jgi:hypothetical protein
MPVQSARPWPVRALWHLELLLVWAEIEAEEEKDDDRTAKQRYHDQQQKWVR